MAPAAGKSGKSLDGGGEDDTIRYDAGPPPLRAKKRSGSCPFVGVDDQTRGGDHFQVEHIVDGQSLESRPGAVAAALDDITRRKDRRWRIRLLRAPWAGSKRGLP